MLKLHPPEDKLIVFLEDIEEVSDSGIIIATGLQVTEHPHQTMKGKVLYVGFDVRKKVSAGEYILFEQRHSSPCEIDGKTCKVIRFKDILGVIKEYKDEQ